MEVSEAALSGLRHPGYEAKSVITGYSTRFRHDILRTMRSLQRAGSILRCLGSSLLGCSGAERRVARADLFDSGGAQASGEIRCKQAAAARKGRQQDGATNGGGGTTPSNGGSGTQPRRRHCGQRRSVGSGARQAAVARDQRHCRHFRQGRTTR